VAAFLLHEWGLNWKTPIICAVILASLSPARAVDPMSYKEVAMLLRNGEDQRFIIKETVRRKLLLPLSPAEEQDLLSLRASPALLSTLHDPAVAASEQEVNAWAAHQQQAKQIAFQSEQESRRHAAQAAAAAQPSPAAPAPAASAENLAGKPVALKFTTADGAPFDLAKWHGKVVLIDFWATWCGPCMQEVPHVVAAYNKYHEKGFEIIGVSLDQDKGAMLRVTAQKGMTWPQYFDGKGWNNAVSSAMKIHSIPAMWLVNKNGIIATTDARGDLEGGIQRLLAE
jgi:thiol-disulfide isomerase/thioredoxin